MVQRTTESTITASPSDYGIFGSISGSDRSRGECYACHFDPTTKQQLDGAICNSPKVCNNGTMWKKKTF